ncbi:DUF2125 domain-containing protein [Pseudemcibacter aquimaris]|uniref:DUF2125 domain-containing protein n=1 Tax=Pseudemcibacter aquimaris TaxID=2857064 RepID=UPI00201282CB|nr:DUF2125 domain-containing protein [Pseudemcibacter aquimaris]MCC3861613.1 DUF2125 domain-containing protein [Pseudemcibacter aquimaris]WDU58382.1 DUF2125 domain-containing protein [Pseudemcibacter aquimaris]
MRIKVIFGSVFALIAAYSFFWFHLAGEAKNRTLEWIEQSEQRLDGIKLYVGDVTVSGFPYKIAIEATTFNVAIPEGKMGSEKILFTLPEIAAVYQPWKPNHIMIVTDYMDAVVGELSDPNLSMNFEKIMSSVILNPETQKLDNFSIIADMVNWQYGLAGEGLEISYLEKPEFHLRRNTGEVTEPTGFDLPVNRAVYFRSKGGLLSELSNSILGDKTDAITLETMLHANSQPDYTVESLAAWRDEGGTVSIKSFSYGTADQHIKISGDMTLDRNMKPLGAFDAEVTNISEVFRRLSENENLPDVARMMLRSEAENNTATETVPLSISMQNGQMYVGPIMVMELPAVIE